MAKKIRDGEGNLIPDRRKNNNGYRLTWGAILLLGTVIGWLFLSKGQTDMKIEKVQTGYSEIKAELSAIKESIDWIKDTLQDKYKKRGGEEK